MSIAMTNMKLHLSCQDNDFRVTKVSGTSQAIVSTNGKDVDIELRELRHGEKREILIELDMENSGSERYSDESDESDRALSRQQTINSNGHSHSNGGNQAPNGGSLRRSPSTSNSLGLGMDTLSVTDSNALRDVVYEDALIDEIPVTEVDCSFSDPMAGRSVARLAHPVLLTIAIVPSSASPSATSADPTIVRRRMELLASDMITRALLIASRKNFGHAARILRETMRIIETVADGLKNQLATLNGNSKSRREIAVQTAVEGLGGVIADLEMLLDGLEEHKEMFERDHRNYSAQQVCSIDSFCYLSTGH